MKRKSNDAGFTFVEGLLITAILLIIAVPILRIVYGSEIKEFESQFFDAIGIGNIGRFIIIGILTFLAIFFKFRPEYLKAKERNQPIVGKPVIYFVLVSLLAVVLMLIFQQ